jgi:hypothetical protein
MKKPFISNTVKDVTLKSGTFIPEGAEMKIGSRIWFAEESRPYRVRAMDGRFLVCTKPFNLLKTVLYCIFDIQTMMRAPENLCFGLGAETDKECQDMLSRINGSNPDMKTELSRRHGIPARVIRFA